jgi:hypothetical protein
MVRIKGKINQTSLLIARGDIYFSDISSGIGKGFRIPGKIDLHRPRLQLRAGGFFAKKADPLTNFSSGSLLIIQDAESRIGKENEALATRVLFSLL